MNVLKPENNCEGYRILVTLNEIDGSQKVNANHSEECDQKVAAQKCR